MHSWVSDAIIYQINLRSLAAREPRNAIEAVAEAVQDLSPFAYVAANIDALAQLGCTVLYLMPPYPIGRLARKGIGSPYSSRDFMAVEPEYGTIDELRAFVAAAHQRSLKVIIDITPNHTSRDHVWTTEHPDYYIRDDNGEMFYDFDWADTAKMNYSSPGLRQAMIGVYDFWLSILGEGENGEPDGVDGFRLDMAHMISDLGFWNEAMETLRTRHASRELLFLAESYGTANNMDLFGRGINSAYDDDFYKVCQYLYALDESGMSIIAESPEAASNADFADKLEAFGTGGIAGAMACTLMNYETVLEPGRGPWLARYTDNHDEGRGLHRFGEGAVRAVEQLAFLTAHCIPFLLTGQEFGAMNRPSIHERMGVCDKGPSVVADDAVLSRPGVEFEGNIFARGRDARLRWCKFYKELIRLRRETPELCDGEFSLLNVEEDAPPAEKAIIAFERRLGDSLVRCAVNLGPEKRTIGREDLFAASVLYGSTQKGKLAPFSGIVVRDSEGGESREVS